VKIFFFVVVCFSFNLIVNWFIFPLQNIPLIYLLHLIIKKDLGICLSFFLFWYLVIARSRIYKILFLWACHLNDQFRKDVWSLNWILTGYLIIFAISWQKRKKSPFFSSIQVISHSFWFWFWFDLKTFWQIWLIQYVDDS